MNNSRPEDEVDRKPEEIAQRKGLPIPDSRFAGVVATGRQRLGMSQVAFAKAAGVSTRTLTQVETNGKARAEIIIKLAIAAGQSIEEWLTLAGHPLIKSQIDDIRIQQERAKNAQPIVRLKPVEEFDRMAERVERYGGALMCYIVTSDTRMGPSNLKGVFDKMFDKGLCIAILCPFPCNDNDIFLRRPYLNKYYRDAFEHALRVAKRSRIGAGKYKTQIAVFLPATRGTATLVTPPVRVAEARPTFVKYGAPSDPCELGTYLRYFDGREDEWIEIYGGHSDMTARVKESVSAWQDYCGDIVESWDPGSRSFSADKLFFWQRVPDETLDSVTVSDDPQRE